MAKGRVKWFSDPKALKPPLYGWLVKEQTAGF